MKLIFTTTLLLILLVSHKSNGQVSSSELEALVNEGIDPYFKESYDTISKYGPDCITRDLLQDKKGNYWLATWKGIIKYDGKMFTNYTLREGLIHFHVASCYADTKGNLWFGTVRGGLYCYDGKKFTLFKTKDGLPDNSVTSFAEDKAGNLWLATDSGLSRYDGKNFTNFTIADGLPNNHVSAITIDKTGTLWVGCRSNRYGSSDGGVSCFNGRSFTGFEDSISHKSITSLLAAKNGTIWIGTFDGLVKYDGKSFNLVKDLPPYLVYYIIEDKKGALWLTSAEPNPAYGIAAQSLYTYDGKVFTKINQKTEPGDNQIFGKIEDNIGNIWFGTMKGPGRHDGKSITYFNY